MKIELCFSENKKNWLKEQTNERVEMYYEAWKAGEISDTDWSTYLWQITENYAKTLIVKKYLGKGEFDDLMQNAALVLMEKYKNFNPYKAKAITYFGNMWVNIASDYKSEISAHYKQMQGIIYSTLIQCGYQGLDDKRLDAAKISTLSNIPIKTVNEVLTQFSYTESSYEELTEQNKIEHGSFLSPEENYLKEERIKEIGHALDTLTPLERWLVEIMLLEPTDPVLGGDKIPSYKNIATYLNNTPEKIPEYFFIKAELPKTVKAVFLQMKYNSGITKLRNELQKKNDIEAFAAKSFVPQASDDDIMDALSCSYI
ncbi:hypothetical protein [Lachnospira multipara]|uniref:hypothetical protein n=1 Tax=Lachnospira multipara TaxID=28051 RepID=UPI0004833D2F|nr:hypothetical protein [Lachnospira multipara]